MSRVKICLALLAGCAGFVLAGANLPVDTQLTIRTKLGKRTHPHWLVQPDSKIVKTEGASGLIRLLGGLAGCAGFGAAMHLAGRDERQQRLFWVRQAANDEIGTVLLRSEILKPPKGEEFRDSEGTRNKAHRHRRGRRLGERVMGASPVMQQALDI